MEIEWVNHAGFVQRHRDVALLSDPWLSGTAFNDGWELLVPSLFTPSDVASVTHIWFSHEHPDHFSPPVLKKIPAEVRQGVQVVFQTSPDQRVAEFCRSIGFTVHEVRDRKADQRHGQERAAIRTQGHVASFVAVRTSAT